MISVTHLLLSDLACLFCKYKLLSLFHDISRQKCHVLRDTVELFLSDDSPQGKVEHV